MDLGTLLRTIVRRWYVTIPALLLVGAAVLVVIDSSDPEYAAQRSVVLVRTGVIEPDPADVGTEESVARNPYAEFTASVGVTAEVLQEVAQSGEFRRVLNQAGLSDDYSVTVDENAPILEIEAVAAVPEIAIESAEQVAVLVTDDLAARQERFGVPEESQIVTDDVIVPERTTRLDTARDRALIGIAVLGVIFVVAVGLLAEVIARTVSRRRSRRKGKAADTSVESDRSDESGWSDKPFEVRDEADDADDGSLDDTTDEIPLPDRDAGERLTDPPVIEQVAP